jgi:hypothetical protein
MACVGSLLSHPSQETAPEDDPVWELLFASDLPLDRRRHTRSRAHTSRKNRESSPHRLYVLR